MKFYWFDVGLVRHLSVYKPTDGLRHKQSSIVINSRENTRTASDTITSRKTREIISRTTNSKQVASSYENRDLK